MEVLRKIDLKQIDYNTIHVQSTDELVLPAKLIRRVGAGLTVAGSYDERVSVEPSYSGKEGSYKLSFEFSAPLDSLKANVQFVIRYYRTDGTDADVEVLLPTYKYPYASAAPLVSASIIPSLPPVFFQDIERDGNKLYYHPLGPFGLFEYDLSTQSNRELVRYPAGDHIAKHDQFIYYDQDHYSVRRYNLITNRTDLVIPYFADRGTEIYGTAASDGNLFVLARRSNNLSVLKFDLEGALLETIPYSKNTYYLASSANILYSIDYAAGELVRFDLQSKTFLPSKLTPAKNGGGIKIYANQLYYIDDYKRFVGMILLDDLE